MDAKYQQIDHSDEKFEDVFPPNRTSSSLSESTLMEDEMDHRLVQPQKRWAGRWMWMVHAALLSLSFTLFVSSWFTRASTLDYMQRYEAYSPAAKAVEYQRVKFNGTMGEGSPYVGKGPEVDKHWNALSYDVGDQMITPEELKIIEMPASSLKVKNPKTGVEGYRVGLQVFHHLHCLNLLRQVTYKDWYMDKSGNFAAGEEELQMHTDHCLEMLRKEIQCNADIGVFTFYMMDGDPLPWPELESYHQCRNFDKVRDWALENSVGNMERGDINPDP
ncbi:Cyclochlorotine biosynthesis protein O [Lachnellula cervina]|uniref:Cyclochlorotine biosynthesis protein O n=1 Tax=Lachnellula cervina TaxID=1316786 RepID=A0A7D8UIS9_9HELO|nr:Cyclochlorotine biosynthesis protein O [Lachnellula cervina]